MSNEIIILDWCNEKSTAIVKDDGIFYKAFSHGKEVVSIYLVREEIEAMLKLINAEQ